MNNPNIIATIYKTAAEDFDCSVDFYNWLTSGDTVASGTVTCYLGTTDSSSTMIATVTDDDDDQVLWRLYGGTAGNVYRITVTATTAASDVFVAYLNCVVN